MICPVTTALASGGGGPALREGHWSLEGSTIDGTAKATFTRVPTLDEVPYPVKMEPNLVVEFYSR